MPKACPSLALTLLFARLQAPCLEHVRFVNTAYVTIKVTCNCFSSVQICLYKALLDIRHMERSTVNPVH